MNTGPVLFCGAWDEGPGYPRTTSLRQGVEASGVPVRDCRVPGLGAAKKALLRAPWRWPAALARHVAQKRRLRAALRSALREQAPRCVVVPYPGHAVVDVVRRTTDRPVVLDLFLSAYDTVVEDRGVVAPGSLAARWLQQLDTRACAAADLVLLDTPENAAYVQALTGLPPERFAWMPIGDPEAPERPAPWQPPTNGRLRVLFFGTGVPLHGLSVLLAAVASAPEIDLVLVGGTDADRADAARLLGDRLRLEPAFVDRTRLQHLLAECHLTAGVFGASGKAQRVVPFKVVHALAAGRPVVTADTPALCGWLEGSGACFTVPAADPAALASMLRDLSRSPDRVRAAAEAARPAYERHFSPASAAPRWRRLLEAFA
ncbi:MAG: glycosyltransferase [Planctomycetes bacterium]|nr:glycosyltransferase [Planctomycetota bacterium]